MMKSENAVPEEPWEDPILKEVHKIRERIFQEAGGTMESYFEFLKKMKLEYADRFPSTPRHKIRTKSLRRRASLRQHGLHGHHSVGACLFLQFQLGDFQHSLNIAHSRLERGE